MLKIKSRMKENKITLSVELVGTTHCEVVMKVI
jgi:hypothetical protein